MNKTFIDILARNNFVVLDTETTGLDKPAELCEIAIIAPNRETLLNTLIKPTRPISPAASSITGITDEMVKDSPLWPEIRPQVLDIIRGKDVIVYNATFDRKIMHWTDEAYNSPHIDYKAEATWYCAMEAYAEYWGEINEYYGTYRWQKLTVAVAQQNILENDVAHRAIADCVMTLKLVQHCCAHLATL